MSNIPPKHSPGDAGKKDADAQDGSLAMYEAAQSEAGSFPVLQAFQKYLDQERTQARRKMFQLSLAFGALIVAVVAVFMLVGVAMMRNMSGMQAKLLDAALARRDPVAQPAAQPAAPAVSPELSASIREATRAANALQASLANEKEEKTNAARNAELQKMRDELAKMRGEVEAARSAAAVRPPAPAKPAPAVVKAPPPAKPSPAKPAPEPGVSPAVQAALTAAKAAQAAKDAQAAKADEAARKAALASIPKPPAPIAPAAVATTPAPAKPAAPDKNAKAPVVATAPAPTKPSPASAKPDAAEKTVAAHAEDPRYPAPTKDPPESDPSIKRPDAPKGLMDTAMPLKTKKSGVIPWRVLIPE